MQLSECIANRIRDQGPVSFHEFMEWCLYDPNGGYYASKCTSIGSKGDFYTSPTLSPVFGILLGKQLEEIWEQMGRPDFTIVEYGAGTGHLCHDIMTYLERNPSMYSTLRYCIIERNSVMRDRAMKFLPDRVKCYNSILEIDDITGCVLSNELIDNFSVHRVQMESELMEVFVDYQDGFTELLIPAKAVLKDYFNELDITLPKGYHTEVNLEALEWISEVALALKSGYVITIDYGHKKEDLYNIARRGGTLICYHKHTINDSFYEHIGEQDITSHVNFSALSHWGKKRGLRETGFTNQGCFLHSLGFREELLNTLSSEADVIRAAQKAARLSQILLRDMGEKYKVLIQQKDVSGLSISSN